MPAKRRKYIVVPDDFPRTREELCDALKAWTVLSGFRDPRVLFVPPAMEAVLGKWFEAESGKKFARPASMRVLGCTVVWDAKYFEVA